MSRYIPKRPEIEQVGLEQWLNEKYTEQGGYAEFVKRMELSEPKTVIARAFGVSKDTIYEWIAIYERRVGDA